MRISDSNSKLYLLGEHDHFTARRKEMLEFALSGALESKLQEDLQTLGTLHSIASNQRYIKAARKGLGELPSSPGEPSQAEIDAAFKKIVSDIVDIAIRTALIYEALCIPTGYASGVLFDTNKNPSNIKTLGSMFVASVVNAAVSGGYLLHAVGSQVNKSSSDYSDVIKNTFKKISGSINPTSLTEFNKSIDKLVIDQLITEDNARLLKSTIKDAVDKYERVAKILRVVEGGAHLANAYHGYRRNENSVLYGVLWGTLGFTGLGTALSQGYAKPLSEVEAFKKSK